MKGAQLRKIRIRLGLRQTDFADLVGVHVMTVSRWERDESKIPEATAHLITLVSKTKRGHVPKALMPVMRKVLRLAQQNESLGTWRMR